MLVKTEFFGKSAIKNLSDYQLQEPKVTDFRI